MADPDLPICIAALYRFARFDDCEAVRAGLDALCRARGVKGTLLLAHEGINGTIAGSDAGIEAVVRHIRGLPGCADLRPGYARATTPPFQRLKVKIKREIVTMGEPDISPLADVGHYVAPDAWNALIADPGTVLIDTRNDYEVAIGTFAGAIDPRTPSFRDFPAWFHAHREALQGRKVAMFCTGGIRCEKATAFLKAEGVEDVYHLEGGILNYLEKVPPERSLWEGECFVFDERVSVDHHLRKGAYELCRACQRLVAAEGAPRAAGEPFTCRDCAA
ncbi:MAG: rhodanese-related sulfurtransferase [Sphingomonas bacterium]